MAGRTKPQGHGGWRRGEDPPGPQWLQPNPFPHIAAAHKHQFRIGASLSPSLVQDKREELYPQSRSCIKLNAFNSELRTEIVSSALGVRISKTRVMLDGGCVCFPGTIMKDHKLCGLKLRKLIISQFWRLRVQNQGARRTPLPVRLCIEPFLTSFQLPVGAGNPWPSSA